ncbi:lysostaphin resistance A-like protein [Gorillibacterium sp. sgz500922]|uniref:CPBP family intramembrane glutamic endopeptidase n=1 Tax=Gorillibacterium sp. sgz500922 TaxID=3446694 RepID=UPI003F6749AA
MKSPQQEMKKETKSPGFTAKHPIWTVVLVELGLFIALFSAGAYLSISGKTDESPVPYAFVPIALLLAVYLLTGKRYLRFGFRGLTGVPRKELLLYVPLAADVLVVLTNGLVNGFEPRSAFAVLSLCGLALLVAFVEETIYRGLILNLLLPRGVRTAVLGSALLFSLTHLLNLVGGQSLPATLLQLAYALLVGLALALLFVKHRSLLPLMAFHFLHDFTQFLVKDQASVLFDSLVVAALLAAVVWLIADLRKSGSVRPQAAELPVIPPTA